MATHQAAVAVHHGEAAQVPVQRVSDPAPVAEDQLLITEYTGHTHTLLTAGFGLQDEVFGGLRVLHVLGDPERLLLR